VRTEFTEGGEGTKNSKSHGKTVRPWNPALRCSPWPHSPRCTPCQRVSTTLTPWKGGYGRRVSTEFTEGGEGTENSKSHMKTVRPWKSALRCSPWPHPPR